MHKYGRGLGARVLPIYGGQAITRQLGMLKRGVDVVVATPGRALDHIARGTLDLDDLKVVVLDEADEMFDMGFAEDLEAIFDATPATHQTVLFSATMPARIEHLARRRLNEPERITVARESATDEGAPLVRQNAYIVARAHKPAALGRVLDVEAPKAALVFCRTRAEVDQLAETLNGRGYRAEALHGGMTQDQRDRVMARLRNETADLIVATDVAARGLDIDQLTHVVNYDVPSDPDSYTHRIGRVGRAGREGVAITLAEPREHRMLKTIERSTKSRIAIEKLPTVADLRARRLELTRSALEDTLVEGGLEPFRVVLDTLAGEYDVVEIALAAVKLAHEASGQLDEDEQEIPDAAERKPEGAQRPRRAPQHDAAVHRRGPHQRRPPARPRRARSRASPASTAARSARSRSPTASRSSRSPTRARRRSSPPCAPARSRARRRRSGVTGPRLLARTSVASARAASPPRC